MFDYGAGVPIRNLLFFKADLIFNHSSSSHAIDAIYLDKQCHENIRCETLFILISDKF